jgi:primary-amine oxidase
MSVTDQASTTLAAASASSLHPLEPLSAEEIAAAVAILRRERALGPQVRFMEVALHEPPKSQVLSFSPGDAVERSAALTLLDNSDGATYEAVVSISRGEVTSWQQIPGVQPPIHLDEFLECENAVKAHPDFQAALARRGIHDLSLVTVDPWSAGNFGFADEEGIRLARTLSWLRASPFDHQYARPIEGVVCYVDLNQMRVLRVDDYGQVPLPPQPGNYEREFVHEFGPEYRQDLKPLAITQPEGVSFQVSGHAISWQKWRLRIGFTPREGLVLYQVGYQDQGRVRPILYRASISEMVVPYGDPGPIHSRKNAFDIGEYGIGTLANSLTLGCDCLGEIRYFDALMTNTRGEVVQIPNAVCLHEEDYGMLWKHFDWRTGRTEVRRSRRLVVSFVATVGNYEYGFFWYFYQDGTIQLETKLTGVINTAALPPGEKPKYGTLIAPGLSGQIHQHFFNARLDFSVDGEQNSVYEVNTQAEPEGPENPFGNAFFATSTLLASEQQAQRLIDPFAGRSWKIASSTARNALGEPTAYKLEPGENCLPFAHSSSSLIKRAGFITRHLWVTPYDERERYAAGTYPNQHAGGDGLPRWTAQDRPLENQDLVVWYTFGHHHVVRPEDWPVMPVGYIGFMLKPVGFFDRSPALDVPPSTPAHGENGHCCS